MQRLAYLCVCYCTQFLALSLGQLLDLGRLSLLLPRCFFDCSYTHDTIPFSD